VQGRSGLLLSLIVAAAAGLWSLWWGAWLLGWLVMGCCWLAAGLLLLGWLLCWPRGAAGVLLLGCGCCVDRLVQPLCKAGCCWGCSKLWLLNSTESHPPTHSSHTR
jgi:hypothetical protein